MRQITKFIKNYDRLIDNVNGLIYFLYAAVKRNCSFFIIIPQDRNIIVIGKVTEDICIANC